MLRMMKLLFVISGVWFLHWLCLIPSATQAIINRGASQMPSLTGMSTNISANGINWTSIL